MLLSEAIEDYGQFIRHELGHAKTTTHAYLSWQRNFARWLTAQGLPDPPVTEVTEHLVRRYSYLNVVPAAPPPHDSRGAACPAGALRVAHRAGRHPGRSYPRGAVGSCSG